MIGFFAFSLLLNQIPKTNVHLHDFGQKDRRKYTTNIIQENKYSEYTIVSYNLNLYIFFIFLSR